jgi:SSS family solute:Na+ symporter
MDIAIILTYFIIFAYFVALIFIGTRSFRFIKGINSFFVADRAASFPFVAGSLFATIIGGSSTIGMAGLGFKQGLVGAWWLLVGAIGLFLLGLFLAEKVRGYAVYTLPEILEEQYGPEAKLLASALIVVAWTGIIAGQIVAAGRILQTILDLPPSLLMVITGIVFIVYTFLGGQHSVVRTDTIQSLIIIVAILAIIPLCLGNVGGVSSIRDALGSDHFSFPVNKYFSWKVLLEYLLLVGSTYLVGPDIYSRIFCARDEKIAERATLAVSVALIPFAFIITLVGMSARVLFPQISPEASFPTMINHLLPIGLNGLVFAALLSALMSSADTCLLTTSTILSADIVNHLAGGDLTESRMLLLSRSFIVLMGLLSLLVALRLDGVISSLLLGYTIYTSGLVLPILLGFNRDRLRLNKAGAISAMVAGGVMALVGKLWGLSLFGFSFGLWGFFLSGLILIAGSRLFRLFGMEQ